MTEILDNEGAARYLKLAPQTLNALRCHGGSPRWIKAGRRVLYDRADLDLWLDERRTNSTRERRTGSVMPPRDAAA